VRDRAEAGGYALVGPSARTWRTDPDTGRLLEPVSEAEHRTLRHLLGNETVTTTEPAWTDTPDGEDIVSGVIPLADERDWTGSVDDDQPAELGLTGGEGPSIDAGPVLTAEEAAHELAADGRPLDEARAMVRGYLDDTSERVGTSVHLWGLDDADLAAMRADPIERARSAAAVLDAASDAPPVDTAEADQADEDGWSR